MATTIPDVSVLRIAVDLACRAPSLHNSQPWRWLYYDGRLDLHGDRTRLLASADPTGRQLFVSCGAALHHLQVALTSLHWRVAVSLFPEAALPHLVASMRFRRDAAPQSHDFDLLTAIRHRQADRRPFAPATDTADLFDVLRDTADRYGTTVTVLPAEVRPVLVAAANASSASRRYDSMYQVELHWWAGHSLPREGIPSEALATDVESAQVPVGRTFPIPVRDDPQISRSIDESTVLVLSTASDLRTDWARCGEALSAVLLEATVRHYATCPLTHITEVGSSRNMIRDLTPNAGYPQILVRVGLPPGPTLLRETPRRPSSEVLSIG